MTTAHTDPPAFSVIVPIAPGRTPAVLDSLTALAARDGWCEVLTQVGPNASRNRNQSIRRARGRFLAFTDDDCRVAPDWLARAAAFFAAHPDYDAVGGPQLNVADQGVVARAGGLALASRFGAYRHSRRYRPARFQLDATQSDLSSANLFITRRAFDRWGPFDERLWPNEETALLHRIELAGGRIAYDPTLVVFHHRRDSLGALARQCFGYGRGRARQSRLEGRRVPGVAQLVPSLFLLYLVLLPVLAPWRAWALLPLGVYAGSAVLIAGATAVARADVATGLVMPLAFVAIHTAYAAGFLAEALGAHLQRRGARAVRAQVAPDGSAVTR